MKKEMSTDMVRFWVHMRKTAWDEYFAASEMVDLYTQAGKYQTRVNVWRERVSLASGKAQYFDALIAAAIDPTFQRDWAIREGVEL